MVCQSLLDVTLYPLTLLSASCTPAELAFACEVVAPVSKRDLSPARQGRGQSPSPFIQLTWR